jgi:hypothetical protein
MDPYALFLILVWMALFAFALPIFRDVYRFLTRSKRQAATRARLAQLPPPEKALKDADRDQVAEYLLELFGDGDVSEVFSDREVKARFDEVVRFVERRRSGKAAAAS